MKGRIMSRRAGTRSLLAAILLTMGTVETLAAEKPGASKGRPNIVVVFADDLGYGDARCYDPQHAKVPLARLP